MERCNSSSVKDAVWLHNEDMWGWPQLSISPITDEVMKDYRENLIWKIKKITDSFEIDDDTFYRASFIYDQHNRLKPVSKSTFSYKAKHKLEDLFVFSTGEEEDQRKYKYSKFFDSLACVMIITKYNESDKNSPKGLDLLKFYWAEKLNLEIKDWKGLDQHSIAYKKAKIELLYNYLWDKQIEILFDLDWKIQTVSVSHFLDHYKRLLPSVSTFKWNDNKVLVTPKKPAIASPKSHLSSDVQTRWVSNC
jgi:hypothetical protein